jgi:protein-tyrosine phosphatase
VAEGLLRRALDRRLGSAAPTVRSAGTIGLVGNPATAEAVEAAAELGVDIAAHEARRLLDPMIEQADLIVCMAAEHREEITARVPGASDRTFTLKELTRLLELEPAAAPTSLLDRIATAAAARAAGAPANQFDQDVVDPLGMPMETYRAIAWELDEWIERLVTGLLGPVSVHAENA